jgi:Ca2+-binding EF-hand superfamily protein
MAGKGNALEDELQKLLAGANLATEGAKDAGKQATKMRRRSKDLEEQLSTMADTKDILKTLGGIADGGKLTDEKIKEIFDEIDDDKNGTLEPDELQKALKKAGKEITGDEVKEMIKKSKAEGKEAEAFVTFDEFKKIMSE